MKKKGKLVVISGPSGAGKSTVVFKALGERDHKGLLEPSHCLCDLFIC